MARIDISRHVEADPASVALLLSGPTGRDLWPEAALVLAPPRRSGVGFRVDFVVSHARENVVSHARENVVSHARENVVSHARENVVGEGRGRILIAAGVGGPIASDVRLTVSCVDSLALPMRRAAEEFLDSLAAAAQARSSAA